MKKLISSILALLMLVSLCAVFSVAADEPTHELKAVVMMKESNYEFRFIFTMTKEDLRAAQVNVDADKLSYGFNCCWGISDSETHAVKSDFHEGFDHGEGTWGFDENGNLYYQIHHNGGYSSEENYTKAGEGKLWGMICNYLEGGNTFYTEAVVHDNGEDGSRPHLKKNTNFSDAGNSAAAVLQVKTEVEYYAEAPVESGEVTEAPAPNPPQTADFSAAIVAVAVLALGATVVVAKKKH